MSRTVSSFRLLAPASTLIALFGCVQPASDLGDLVASSGEIAHFEGLDVAAGQVLVSVSGRPLPGRIDAADQGAFALKRALRGGTLGVYSVPAGLSVEDAIADLSASGTFAAVGPDLLMSTTEADSGAEELALADDPRRADQWNMDTVEAERAWTYSTGEGVIVAVIDSGVFADGEDGISDLLSGYDFGDDDDDPNTTTSYHGTHVAGTIGQRSNNGVGVIGLAPYASILPVKVFPDASDNCAWSDVIAGIEYAVDQGADVINISLGAPSTLNAFVTGLAPKASKGSAITLHALCDAVRDAADAGVFVAVAAGNNSNGAISYPAACDGAVPVGATTKNNSRANFSNYGSGLALMAPGKDILQEINVAGDYETLNGTSMASPHVAAAAALLMSAGASSDEALVLLEETALDLGDAGYDRDFGYGLIQPAAALALLLEE